MRTTLDANAVLRYVLNDVPEQSAVVREAVLAGAQIVPEALCECVYVLTGSYYSFSRQEASRALSLVLEDIGCEHLAAMRRALDLFSQTRLDFVDCVLAARSEVDGARILTFDKRLARLIDQLAGK